MVDELNEPAKLCEDLDIYCPYLIMICDISRMLNYFALDMQAAHIIDDIKKIIVVKDATYLITDLNLHIHISNNNLVALEYHLSISTAEKYKKLKHIQSLLNALK